MLRLLLISVLSMQASLAYIDTTSKSFQKPKPIEVKAYKYKESKVDKYIDMTADKVGGSFLGNVIGGPTALILKVSDRAFRHQEKKAASSSSQSLQSY